MKNSIKTSIGIRLSVSCALALAFAYARPPGGPPPQNGGGMAPAQRPRPIARVVSVPAGNTQLGDPLPGLTAEQLALFGEGLDEFESAETVAGGLGPIFNNVSCVACHNAGGTGGASAILVTRFGHTANGKFDPLDSLGGSLLQENAIDPGVQEIIPAEANITANRQSTPLFGLGLIEAIPDDAILRNAQHPPIDGITGRAAIITDIATGQQRVGRFGWKNQHANLLSFAGDAYLNEMGVTSRLFPKENAPNGNLTLLAEYDKTEDPEDTVDPNTGESDIDHAADFMRLLAAPQPLQLTRSANTGRQLFQQMNCAICHVPSMMTGPSLIASLNKKPVGLYSDLLLHQMGKLGDGIVQSAAGAQEMRTAPLWGLRASAPYLHDGRAPNIDMAIRLHDGEAQGSRDRYIRANPTQQQQVIDFLKSL